MASPFPGMDPYIETPELWPDFHGNLATEIQGRLNPSLQPDYFARLTPYVTYDVIQIARVPTRAQNIRPDVGVFQPAKPGGPAVAEMVAPPATVAPVTSAIKLEVPLELFTVEIRETEHGTLVTAIEILSPVNKRPGHEARADYLRKRRELLRSAAHVLEIDLLRGGERSPLEEPVPSAPYYITLGRADTRPTVEVWPVQLADRLPVLPVPLCEPDPDVLFDLNAAVASVYERGAYAASIDYRKTAPPPAFSANEAAWMDHLLAPIRQPASTSE